MKSKYDKRIHSLENKREGQVKAQKDTKQARGTHRLSSIEGGRSHNTEKSQIRGMVCTFCQAQREGQVRILKESKGARVTH
jgi:hypothetical protein